MEDLETVTLAYFSGLALVALMVFVLI
jgi:hypothetical protein